MSMDVSVLFVCLRCLLLNPLRKQPPQSLYGLWCLEPIRTIVSIMWAGWPRNGPPKVTKSSFVSVTNGDAGHVEMGGGALAIRRTAEVHEAAKVLGIESEVLDIHDGELMPTLENRRTFVKLIREWQADIVIGPPAK